MTMTEKPRILFKKAGMSIIASEMRKEMSKRTTICFLLNSILCDPRAELEILRAKGQLRKHLPLQIQIRISPPIRPRIWL